MTRKRRTFGAAFKAKVALAAAKGDRTTAQLASEYGVHAGQVTAWKKQLMEQVTELFTDGRKRRSDEAANEHELYEQIGRLKMEVEWLKKNLPRSAEVKRRCVETDHESLSVSRQCQLLGLARSSWYHAPLGERHHLHPNAARVPLSHCRYGSLQPQRSFLAAVEHADGGLLRRGLGRSVQQGNARDLQH